MPDPSAPIPRQSEPPTGFVLVNTLTSRTLGKPVWFKQMTGIGPMSTADESERYVFRSEEAARRCPAMFHALSFFEVEAIEGGSL